VRIGTNANRPRGDEENRNGALRRASISRAIICIVAMLAMLAAPLSLLARGTACADACTKMCCMMHDHAMQGDADEGMHCHNSSGQAAGTSGSMNCCHMDCCMNSNCNHALDYGFAIPLPLTVLVAPFHLSALADFRSTIPIASSILSAGFLAAPFKPPRC
jgi:hypothetical protein